jgi:hypothetical protein
MKLFPRRLYGKGRRFAVAGRVEYRHVEQDELLGSTDDGGMAFEVRDRCSCSLRRSQRRQTRSSAPA